MSCSHTRLPCPSLSPGVCSNSCPLSQWCQPTVSSSVTLFSSCPQSFPSSGSFPMSWFFASGGQSIGALASASVLPMNIQGWFPLGLTDLISLLSKGLLRVFSSTIIWKHLLRCSAFFMIQLPHLYIITGKTIALTIWTFVDKVMSLIFNMLSRLEPGGLQSMRLQRVGQDWATKNSTRLEDICVDMCMCPSHVCLHLHM